VVDSTDLIIITSVVQTVVITLTLAVFIFQFRSQEKSIRESAVQNVMGRYTDYVRMLVERPELAKLLEFTERGTGSDGRPVEKLSSEDEAIYAYLLLGYGLLEEVYSLYKKNWMNDETWQQWSAFLEIIAVHPLFKRVHNRTVGTFDKDFQDLVSKLVQDSERDPS
jgi:hypothetical protein